MWRGTDRNDHIARRETALGRRLPAILYAANIAGWVATSVAIGVSQLLLLSLLTLPALALYLWRTRRL
jgi:hypothetical protein